MVRDRLGKEIRVGARVGKGFGFGWGLALTWIWASSKLTKRVSVTRGRPRSWLESGLGWG